jgi:dTDP-4-amino-4,6-dideoxygalactose transaminase
LSFLNGRMAGRFGVASFYSFASTKYWPAGGGGLAVVHDSRAARRMARAVEFLSPPSRWEELRNLALQAAKAAVFQRPLYGIFGRPMRRWAENWALLEPRLDLNGIQPSYAAAARRQALRLPERVERQRANSLRLLARLGRAEDVVLPRERPGARYNYHIFPVLLRNGEERSEVRDRMWRQFVDTSMIYSQAIEECRRYGYRGGCPVAESVSERLITLPNHAALTGRDVDVVAEVFLAGLQASRGARAAYLAPASETAGDL